MFAKFKLPARCRCGEQDHQLLKSLLDQEAWKTTQRLSRSFCILWYLYWPLALVSMIYTLVAASSFPDSANRIPYVSQIVTILAVILPFYGVYSAAKLVRRIVLNVTFSVGLFIVGYRVVFLIYLNVDAFNGTPDPSVKLAETVLSSLNLVLGVVLLVMGAQLYRKVKDMNRTSRSVLVVGLDNSGKTSLLYHVLPIKSGVRKIDINPTAGLRLHKFTKWDTQWRVWDMSGQGRNRELWQSYYSSVHAIVFVVDCTDLKRLGNAKDEFQKVLGHPDVKERAPLILVLGNKSDLEDEDSIDLNQLRNVLRVDRLAQSFHIKLLATSGMSGSGVQEGFQWINAASGKFFEDVV